MKPSLLILAAGIGSRYGSLKQLDKLGPSGETIIDYSVFDALRSGFGKVVFVIRKSIATEFEEVILKKISPYIHTSYVLQELDMIPDRFTLPADRVKPWGTGHAVLMAANEIQEPFAVINADDFYGAGAYKAISDFFNKDQTGEKPYSMVGYRLENTLSEFGTVSRGVCSLDHQKNLTEIVERTKIERTGQGIAYLDEKGPRILDPSTIVSMNFWGFQPDVFDELQKGFSEFLENGITNNKSEYYIPTLVNNLIGSGRKKISVLDTPARWFGVTYQEDRALAVKKIHELVAKGDYPAKLWS